MGPGDDVDGEDEDVCEGVNMGGEWGVEAACSLGSG